MFGQTADAVVRVRSSRQIQDVSASLEQLGWIVSAPSQSPAICGNDLADQNAAYHFDTTRLLLRSGQWYFRSQSYGHR